MNESTQGTSVLRQRMIEDMRCEQARNIDQQLHGPQPDYVGGSKKVAR